MADLQALAQAIINGKAPDAKSLTESALSEGVSPADVLNNGLVAGMNVVGEKFKNNEFYVPEVLIAARAMKNAMEVLRPQLAATGVEPKGRVAIGTVRGDLHDIGKNLVAMMLEGAGFEIMDMGVDVKPEQFVQAVKDGAGVIAMGRRLCARCRERRGQDQGTSQGIAATASMCRSEVGPCCLALPLSMVVAEKTTSGGWCLWATLRSGHSRSSGWPLRWVDSVRSSSRRDSRTERSAERP